MNAEITLNENFLNWSRAILIGDENNIATTVSRSDGVTTIKCIIPLKTTQNINLDTITQKNYWGAYERSYYGQVSLCKFENNNPLESSDSTTFYTVFLFGEGNATPTKEDFVLAQDPTSPVSENNFSTQIDYTDVTFHITSTKKIEDNKAVTSFSITIYNRKEEPLNIKEVALAKRFATSLSTAHTVIFGRGVLDEPLLIAPSDMKTINIDLKM